MDEEKLVAKDPISAFGQMMRKVTVAAPKKPPIMDKKET